MLVPWKVRKDKIPLMNPGVCEVSPWGYQIHSVWEDLSKELFLMGWFSGMLPNLYHGKIEM